MCNIVQILTDLISEKHSASMEPTSTPHPLLKTMETLTQAAGSPSIGADSCDPESVVRGAGSQSTEKESITQSLDFEKYIIGFTPVDIRGRPILDTTGTGGWRATLFIFGNEMAERAVFYGYVTVLLFYLTDIVHLSFPATVVVVTNVIGAACIAPLLGAFLADAYWGRYWTIGIFTTIYLVGIVLLTLSAVLPGMRPSNAGCTPLKVNLATCEKASGRQNALLYTALYTMALGTGGIRPCVSSFGADQFDVEDPKENAQLTSYFNYFYLTATLGAIFSLTLIVYVCLYVSWGWGYGTLAMFMALSNILFFIGTPLYRHRLPSGSPLTRLAQVGVASARKWKTKVPADPNELYEVHDKESAIVGSRKLGHTATLRFFDKAAVETEKDKVSEKTTAWSLCTITQVEELKALIRVLPIWATAIMLNTNFIQIINFTSIPQAVSMDRRWGKFVIPPPTVGISGAIFVVFFLPIYDRLIVPAMRRITGDPRGISYLQRMGVGLFFSVISVMVAALVERRRRQVSYETNTASGEHGVVPMSAYLLTFQVLLAAFGEIFASVGQLEFFYDQAPDGLKSLGVALFAASLGLGAWLGSLLVTITNRITAPRPWVSGIISYGHYDYYYWLLAVLSALNFVAYVICARVYRHKVAIKSTMRTTLTNARKPRPRACVPLQGGHQDHDARRLDKHNKRATLEHQRELQGELPKAAVNGFK